MLRRRFSTQVWQAVRAAGGGGVTLQANCRTSCDRGSAVAGWVMVVPLVLAVMLGGVSVAQVAFAATRVHAAAVRIAYAAASASDTRTRENAVKVLAAQACSQSQVRWHTESVAGVLMIAAQLQCHVTTVFGSDRQVLARAHAPLEIP